jgi:hypothetical protein
MRCCFHWVLAFIFVAGLPVAASAAGSRGILGKKAVMDKAKALAAETASELAENGWKAEAALWTGATPDEALLTWAYATSTGSLQPAYWLVSVSASGKRIGLLALSPGDGDFVWRATALGKKQGEIAAQIFSPKPDKVVQLVKSKIEAKEHYRYDLEHVVLASVSGGLFWLVPAKGENLIASACFPVWDTATRKTLFEAVDLWRSGIPSRQEAVDSGPPIDLKPSGDSGLAASGETWMAREVPLLFEPMGGNGWALALGMLRQWWSPVPIGTKEQILSSISGALGKARAAVPLEEMHRVMTRWAEVGRAWDKQAAPNGIGFEDFRAVWFGQGAPLDNEAAGVSWKSNDVRSWIAREAPVIAAVDADGLGDDEPIDHYVLLVGASAKYGRLYANTSWGLADTFSALHFDKKFWSAWYMVSCDLPALCATPTYYRRGMVGGAPGDLSGPPTVVAGVSLPRTASDSHTCGLANVGLRLGPPAVPGFAGLDSFGEAYRNECSVEIPGGRPLGGEKNGDWTQFEKVETKDGLRVTATSDRLLAAGGLLGGGGLDLAFSKPTGEGGAKAQVTCRTSDPDDRTHFQDDVRIKVHDDAMEAGGSKMMRKPRLVSSYGREAIDFSVVDDDPSPPTIEMLSPRVVYDGQKEAYRFSVRLLDASGIADASAKWSLDGKEPKKGKPFDQHQGDVYWLDVPRTDWISRLDGTISFWVTATDGDKDREGDASSTSATFSVAIQDDDLNGPNLVQTVVERAENMQFRVLVKLTDKSGIFVDESWPKLYYSFKDTISAEEFDGLTKMVPDPKMGKGWFTAVAPWGEAGAQEAAAAEGKKKDTFLYFKIRAYDLDNDREKDDSESWSLAWSEVYLPAPLADTRTIVDIWPAGEVESGAKLWDDWFDPPPREVPSALFFEGRPMSVNPPPVPEIVEGNATTLRIHFAVSLAFVHAGATLVVTGASQTAKPFELKAEILSKKGLWNLGTLTFKPEDEVTGDETLPIPPGAFSTGENILVLTPSEKTGSEDRLNLQHLIIEAKELAPPPKPE